MIARRMDVFSVNGSGLRVVGMYGLRGMSSNMARLVRNAMRYDRPAISWSAGPFIDPSWGLR